MLHGCRSWFVAASALLMPVIAAHAASDERLELLSQLVADESPRVRVEALRALSKIQTAESATLALRVLEKPMDSTLDYALWLTINDLAEPWIAAVESGAWQPEGRERQLEFAIKSLKPGQASRILETLLTKGPLPRDGSGPWIEVIGSAGSPTELRRLLDQVRAEGFETDAVVRVLKAFQEAARLRNQRPDGDLGALAMLLRSPSEIVRLEAVKLAGYWKDLGEALPVLIDDVAANSKAPAELRSAAFDALRLIGGESVARRLKELVAPDRDASLRRDAAITLSAIDGTAGFPKVIEVAATLEGEAPALNFWRSVLAIKGSGPSLAAHLGQSALPPAVARAGVRAAREGGRPDLELITAFAKSGGLATETANLTADFFREFAARATSAGDPSRGEEVYRRIDLGCATCHAIGGAGGKTGPDLTSLGASAPMDYLVESLLLPSAKIKEGYHSILVETRDGEEISGTLSRETPEELFLRNATGQEVAVPKARMAARETGRLSLMPSNLLDPLTEQQQRDLLAFLHQLGKPGPFDASKGGIARLWRIANVVHTDLQNDAADWFWTTPFTNQRWASVYTLVSGELPKGVLEEASRAQPWTSKVALVLATEVDQAAPGTLRFRSNAPESEIWVDQRKLGAGSEVEGQLPAGRHRVVVKLDPRRLPETFRLEAEGTAFLLE